MSRKISSRIIPELSFVHHGGSVGWNGGGVFNETDDGNAN